ncbi:MAG: butyrate kinase [FCB group bacterium]|nr:butyrate kinase [FCB group bacterium]
MSENERMILAINPGGSSTKVGLFRETKLIYEKNIRHKPEELKEFSTTYAQTPFRRELIEQSLSEAGYSTADLSAIVARGGAFKPLQSGTYRINGKLIEDIIDGSTLQADHPSNLGAAIAFEIAEEAGLTAYFVDPVCVDEMIDEARYSGLPELQRPTLSHALNIRMVAYKASERLNRKFDELNMVVIHLGSGISINALRKGRMIDTSGANDGGPFSPQRVGALPTTGLVKLCLTNEYTWKDLKKKLLKEGGLYAYTGSDHVGEIIKRAEAGDTNCEKAMNAFVYQIAKEAGAMSAVLKGDVDVIVITGGVAHEKWVTDKLTENLSFIAGIIVFPGEEELEALMLGVHRIMNGIEEVKIYR